MCIVILTLWTCALSWPVAIQMDLLDGLWIFGCARGKEVATAVPCMSGLGQGVLAWLGHDGDQPFHASLTPSSITSPPLVVMSSNHISKKRADAARKAADLAQTLSAAGPLPKHRMTYRV